jgi:Tol biopolymer transport system component
MKKAAIILLFASLTAYSQQVSVIEEERLTNPEEGQFYYPGMSPDGGKVLYTSENYKGLWIMDLSTGGSAKLNDDNGAGYEPQFSNSGSEIIYRSDKFVNGKRYSSMFVQNISSKEKLLLEQDVRNLYPPKASTGGLNQYLKNGALQKYSSDISLSKSTENIPAAFIENTRIALYSKGQKKILTPLGEGNYIWPSVSPDGKMLLFTLAGKGTYVCDLEGNIISDLGYANYPSWSRDGKWIVFMEDYDDGYVITSSEIGVVSADGSSRFQLTESADRIELYPKWSPSTDEIVFHTDTGEIYKLTLAIN